MTGRVEHALDRLLKDVIADEGGTCRPQEIRDELIGVIERVNAEQTAAGQEMAEFCYWTVTGGVAVFTFIGEELGVYVVPCPPTRQWELVNRFDRMPPTDVEAYRARLHARYGKERPDLVIKPDLAFDWLFGERAEDTGTSDGYAEAWTGELWTTGLQAAHASEPEPTEPTEAGEPTEPAETAGLPATGRGAATNGEPATEATTAQPEPPPVCVYCRETLVFRGQTQCHACGRDLTDLPEPAQGSTREGRTDGTEAEPAEAAEPEESTLTLMGDPLLEQMMAAVRAAGGGKGRPFRRSDFD